MLPPMNDTDFLEKRPYDPPLDPFLNILYQDDDLLALDKPSGLLHVPGRDPRLSDSLQTRLLSRFPTAGTIHRLDCDTSGIVVAALNKKAHAFIAAQFENKSAEKIYTARVNGDVAGDAGQIDLPLAIDPDRKPRHHVDHVHGRPAQTLWRVLAREDHGGRAVTRLELRPLTGRTHQLRVHMAASGHTILGDVFYGDKDIIAAAPRLQLHAQSLSILHPADGQARVFTAPCPF